MNESNYCPLCSRPLPEKPSKHHLIPKTFKGKDIVLLHRVCHRQIHANFTERELLNYYYTIERLLENENIRKFVDWVKNKPPDFHVRTRNTSRKNSL
ncbi:MAG: HNH endonuclease [Thermodesulfobacteriota bacterium]